LVDEQAASALPLLPNGRSQRVPPVHACPAPGPRACRQRVVCGVRGAAGTPSRRCDGEPAPVVVRPPRRRDPPGPVPGTTYADASVNIREATERTRTRKNAGNPRRGYTGARL